VWIWKELELAVVGVSVEIVAGNGISADVVGP